MYSWRPHQVCCTEGAGNRVSKLADTRDPLPSKVPVIVMCILRKNHAIFFLALTVARKAVEQGQTYKVYLRPAPCGAGRRTSNGLHHLVR